MKPTLVIGYGNELRKDDGLGSKLADVIARLSRPEFEVLRRHQLTPELAEPISRAARVVFIDASIEAPAEVRIRPLVPDAAAGTLLHSCPPSSLLALAQAIYGTCPPAWWMTLPAFELDFGESLSSRGEAALKDGLAEFQRHFFTAP